MSESVGKICSMTVASPAEMSLSVCPYNYSKTII